MRTVTVSASRTLALALLIFSVAACAAFRPGPAEIVESFYRHLEAGEIDRAIDLLSVSTTQVYGREKIQALLAEQSRSMRSKGAFQIAIISESVTGDVAEVVARVSVGNPLGDGSTKNETTKLIRENGDWRITADK